MTFKKGINYGFGSSSATNVVTNELTNIKNNGILAVRPTLLGWNDTTNKAALKNACSIAKSLGLKVIWGGDPRTTVTSSNIASYKSWLVALAVEMNGLIDVIEIANEIENIRDSSLTDAQVRTHMIDLGGQVRAAGFVGDIIYAPGIGTQASYQTQITAWYNENFYPNLTKIDFHVYDTWANFQSQIAYIAQNFGNKAILGEWADQKGFSQWSPAISEETWAATIRQRLAYLQQIAITYPAFGNDYSYFYTYREQVGLDSRGFGLKTNNANKFRTAWWAYTENSNVYFQLPTTSRATALTKGTTGSVYPDKNVHFGISGSNDIFQAEYSDADLTYMNANFTYYGDHINGQCDRNGV